MTDRDPLLDYFDELLNDTGAEPESGKVPGAAPVNPHPPAKQEQSPQPKLQPQPLEPMPANPMPANPRPAPVDSKPQLAELEAVKREQLQALLARQMPAVAPAAEVAPTPEVVEIESSVAEPPAVPVVAEAQTPEVGETASEPLQRQDSGVLISDELESNALANDHMAEFLEWRENGRPLWAQERFDALLFTVSGLTLAVPLIALGQIQTIGEELTPIFGQSDWFMGLLNTPHGQVRTVNTALFVMPEKYSDSFLETAKYVITIDGLPWGLAVDSVNQPITLDPGDVKWRTQRTSRPWLAGTVKSAMCALIDIPCMGAMLQASDKRQRR